MRRRCAYHVLLPPSSSSYVCAVAVTRRWLRAVPDTPAGSIQDFSGSTKYSYLAQQQMRAQKQLRQRRQQQQEEEEWQREAAATARAAHACNAEAMTGANEDATRRAQRPSSSTTTRSAAQHGRGGRVYASTVALDLMPPIPESYQGDLRIDPAYAHLPRHIVAAKQSMLSMQDDSFGPITRGVVPPPAPLTPEEHAAVVAANYTPPHVQLDTWWWYLVMSFAVVLVVLAAYGK